MLYDKRWEKTETKPAVFSLESLIAWLEQQPANRTYNWYSVDGCLMCFYLQSHGYRRPSEKPGLFTDTIEDWGDGGYYEIGMTQPWTFGAALDRARIIRASLA